MSKRLACTSALFAALMLGGCASGGTEQAKSSPAGTATPKPEVIATTPVPESTEVVGGVMTTSGPEAVDDAFLASWKTFFPSQSDGLAIAQALNICDSFKVGISSSEQSTTLQDNQGVTAGDAAFMIGSALIAYCPEFSDENL